MAFNGDWQSAFWKNVAIELARRDGMSFSALADGIGVTNGAVSKWRSGDNALDIHTAGRIAGFLDKPLWELLAPDDEDVKPTKVEVFKALRLVTHLARRFFKT